MALYPENTYARKPIKISDNIKRKKDSCEIAAVRNPRDCYKLPFSTWSLRVLAGYISKELNLVDSISQTEIRNILLKHGIRYRQSKVTLGDSISRIPFEKKRIEEEELKYNKLSAVNSVLFYEDEKGPVAAKKHIWWYIMVLFCTIKGGIQQGSKDKRHSKRVWCI